MQPISDLEFIATELLNIANYLKHRKLSIPEQGHGQGDDPLGSAGQPFRGDFGPAGSDPMAQFIAGIGRS
jgi:hypothetical protein